MPQYNAGLDAVQGLLQLVGQGASAVGNQIMDNSPIAAIGKLLGSASNIPAAQDLQANTQGTQQHINSLTPMQQDALKTVLMNGYNMSESPNKIKGLKDHAAEFVQQVGTVAAEQHLAENTPPESQDTSAPNNNQPPATPPVQQSSSSPIQQPSILHRLLSGFAEGFASEAAPNLASSRLINAQTATAIQKLAGKEPIQPKDIQDLNIQSYSAMRQIANDAWQRSNDELGKMQEQYKILQEGRSAFGKSVGGQTSQMKALSGLMTAKMQEIQKRLQDMKTLHDNPPTINQSKNSFATESEAKKAGLPDGTPIVVGGVSGVWSNK